MKVGQSEGMNSNCGVLESMYPPGLQASFHPEFSFPEWYITTGGTLKRETSVMTP